MKRILIEDINIEEVKDFQNKYYYGNLEPEFDFQKYFIDPLSKVDKGFFEDVYNNFDGKSGSQHALLMTELGEFSCAYIDFKNAGDIFYEHGCISEHEEFKEESNISYELKKVARKLACKDHVREEIADVLMLLYQFAILEKIDLKNKLLDLNLEEKHNLKADIVFDKLLYSVSSFDHQLNRQARGREDYSHEQKIEKLCDAIVCANKLSYLFDCESKVEAVNKYEYVFDENAKSVQEWFDYKVERTSLRMEEIINKQK